MKKPTAIYITLLLAALVGIAVYLKIGSGGSAMPAGSGITTPGGVSDTGFPPETSAEAISSPVPTVAQIPLRITSPANSTTVTNPTLIIRGITSPKADVFVNDAQVVADAQGNFTVQVTLDEGENTLVVTSNDANGNYSEQDITVTYNSGQ